MNKFYNTYFKFIIALFIIAGSLLSFENHVYAQQTDGQLALSYFQNKEYEKAASIYKRLFEETGFKNHRDYYLRCLLELRKYDEAENFLKRELRRNRNDFYLMIDIGMVYLSLGRVSESDEKFKKAIGIASSSRNNIIAAASTFQRYRNFKWAEKTYIEGAERTGDNFDYELGNIYFMQRNYEKMIKSYVNNLKTSPQRLNIIQNRLQHIISREIDENFDEIVERVLLQEIQNNPELVVLTELLIWQFAQTGKFEAALNQTIAIDRRNQGDGRNVYDFGKILVNNSEYELAIKAFQYIIDKGENHSAYQVAYIEYLNTLFIKNTQVLEPDIEELKNLEKKLEEALTIVRRNKSFSVIYALAQLKSFYLGKQDEAIKILTEEIENRRLNFDDESNAKLLLGDIYILNDNPWEATLIYAQVERANPESTIGHEARFKRAKLAYYTGEFEWAQAQLIVLKASTSKLIANDALDLSIFISDNYNLDTIEIPMKLFARADFLIFTKQYNDALFVLDSISNLFPNHKLQDNILYRKANIYENTSNYIKASELYQEVATAFYFDILADKALYRYALLQEKLNNYYNAEDAYFRLISEYPASIYAVEARRNLRKLNEKNLIP